MKQLIKKTFSIILIGAMLTLAAGCSSAAAPETDTESISEAVPTADTEIASETVTSAETDTGSEDTGTAGDTVIRVGSLKGPTSMGLVSLMESSEEGSSEGSYDFTMSADISEITALFAGGNIDIALVPANVASVLYNKTDGNAAVLNINTLGVLYCVSGDESISSITDLEGKTILSTGQGATPEYALRYLLSSYGVNADIEFLSEATEVAARLSSDPSQIAVLPQPFVTAAEAQNDALRTAFSLSDAWDEAEGDYQDSKLLTGVTIVRKDFLTDNKDAVEVFMKESRLSAEMAAEDPDAVAELIAKYGIIEKAPVARKALPECNIVYIDGSDMKSALSGYLEVLYSFDPASVGGKLPADDFYYTEN